MQPPKAIPETIHALQQGTSFLIVSHAGPDGDALGSTLLMSEFLEAIGKTEITCINADPVPTNYRWLPFADTILPPDAVDARPDTVVILDCSKPDRVGAAKDALPRKARTIVIDHHLEDDPAGDVNFVDPSYAATGEMIVDLYQHANVEMTEEAALLAYVAIATDTGGFRYSNTTPRTHRQAAQLVERGVNVAELSERLFDRISLPKFNLMARVLGNAKLSDDGRVAALSVHDADLRDTGASPQDIDGIINIPRNVESVQVACILKETGPTTTKISLRARPPFNAAEFCKTYGGGGHAGAAGATINAPIDEIRDAIVNAIHDKLGEDS